MKKLFYLLLIICILLSGCTFSFDSSISKEVKYTKPFVTNVDDSYFPDFESYDKNGNSERYENITPQMLDAYIEAMIADGFECKRDMYNALLFKQGVMIQITDNTKSYNKCSVTVYTAMNSESESALTEAEALNIIDDDKVFFLLEQSPEGFFEATGAQYYFTPIHSFNYLTYEETHIPENSQYYTSKCMVAENGCVFVDNTISAPIVCDINNDEETDIIFLGYGPTSGVFTITLEMYNVIDGVPELDSSNIFQLNHGDIDIGLNDDGKPVLYYCPNDSDEYTEYLIEYNDKLIVRDLAFAN